MDLFEETTGFLEFLHGDALAEHGVDFCERHVGMQGDSEHIHSAVRRARSVCGGCTPSASAQIMLSRAVEVLDAVGGLGNTGIVVAMEKAFCVAPGDLLDVFDEPAEIGATTALGRPSVPAGEEGEEPTPDGFPITRRAFGPEDPRDTNDNRKTVDDPLGQGDALRGRL